MYVSHVVPYVMSRNTTATDEVEIEVLYTTGPHSADAEFDEDGEAYELARDLRGFGTEAFDEFDRDPQHALDTAYDALFDATVDHDGDIDALLGNVYERLQGPRTDEQLGYDGSETRSLGVGDVIVVDGTPYMVERFGFADLSDEYGVEHDDRDDDPELVTDGGVDTDTLDRQGELLTSQLMTLDRVHSAGRKRGSLDATVTVEGTVDDVPGHLFRVADRYDLNVVHRKTKANGRGVETVVEICSDERRDTVLDYCEKYDRDVQVLADTGPEIAADGGRDPVTFDGYSEIDSAYYLITQHARKSRQAGYEDHADELFGLSTFLLDAITFGEKSDGLDRDDYSVTVDGEQLDLLYEAFEYAVEQEAATGPVQARDVALARRVYNGGSTAPQVTTDDLDDDTAPDATPVYVHRDQTRDELVSDFVFCSFGYDHVDGLDGAGASATEWVESQVMQQFDGDDEQLDDLLTPEYLREASGGDPPRVGTLYFDEDGGQVVALELDADAFEYGGA